MKKPKKSRLVWGIVLAAVGLTGLPGTRSVESPALYLVTCILLITGGALLIIFYVRALKRYKRKITDDLEAGRRMQAEADEWARAAQEMEEQRRIQVANALRTCPHCGAATKGDICEYCGSRIGG